MPWMKRRTMSQKIEFVERAQKGERVSALCREYSVSRTTAHKWLRRFREQGYDGLEERSRRPRSTPLSSAEEIVVSVLQAREAHPRWGPKKLRDFLVRKLREQTPSERTIARILRRAQLVRQRRRRAVVDVVERAPRLQASAPNEVWTVDFKGWWRAVNGERCDPLTVRDAYSRYVLASELCDATTAAVQKVFQGLFRRHGVPGAIQCDNGVPFVSVRSRGGLSQLSAWWMSLGIKIFRSRPGCPQDNGAHERMHADMRADLQQTPAPTREDQQKAIDRWRQEFNHVRPHEALKGKTPGEVYKPAERRKAVQRRYSYRPEFFRRTVSACGHLLLGRQSYFLSASLGGYDVGVEVLDALHARVWFHDLDLGVLELGGPVPDDVFEALLWTANGTNRPVCSPQAPSGSPKATPQVISLPPDPPREPLATATTQSTAAT
jgi:putative transposase